MTDVLGQSNAGKVLVVVPEWMAWPNDTGQPFLVNDLNLVFSKAPEDVSKLANSGFDRVEIAFLDGDGIPDWASAFSGREDFGFITVDKHTSVDELALFISSIKDGEAQ